MSHPLPEQAVEALREMEWARAISPGGPAVDSEEWARMRLEQLVASGHLVPVERVQEVAEELRREAGKSGWPEMREWVLRYADKLETAIEGDE